MVAFAVLSYLLVTAVLPNVQASPIGVVDVESNIVPVESATTVTALTASQESAYTPAALFASAAYCPASETINWACGGKPSHLYYPLGYCCTGRVRGVHAQGGPSARPGRMIRRRCETD